MTFFRLQDTGKVYTLRMAKRSVQDQDNPYYLRFSKRTPEEDPSYELRMAKRSPKEDPSYELRMAKRNPAEDASYELRMAKRSANPNVRHVMSLSLFPEIFETFSSPHVSGIRTEDGQEKQRPKGML